MFGEVLYNYNSNFGIPNSLLKHINKSNLNNTRPKEGDYNTNKFLTIIACHSDTERRVKIIINNINKVSFPGNTIIIVDSNDTFHHSSLKIIIGTMYPDIKVYSIRNSPHLDIGKCMFYIKKHYEPLHDHIILTNDSYYLTDTIYHYYKSMTTNNAQLYGYNDSTQSRYHYQSYLYAVRKEALVILINHYNKVSSKLTGYAQVVEHIELKLCDIFSTKDCFLKIGNLPYHRGKNIFFNSDKLYNFLLKKGVLPIIKIKRISNPYTYQGYVPRSSAEVTSMSNITQFQVGHGIFSFKK